MKRYRTNFALIALAVSMVSESACAETWTNYRIPETGSSVDIPSSIFTEDIGNPEGYGQRLRSSDGHADLTVQSIPIERGVSPAAFLASKNPPPDIIYKRVTPRFFVISSIKRDKIWYDRCNFAGHYVHLRANQLSRSRETAVGWDCQSYQSLDARRIGQYRRH